jgi:beta-galactosidase
MNRRELLQVSGGLAMTGLGGGLWPAGPATAGAAASASPRQDLLLDRDWRFFEGDIAFPDILSQDDSYDNAKAGKAWGAAATSFDDSEWPLVTVPHDFVSFQPIEKDANRAQGYRRRGIAWYRTSFELGPEDHGKHIELQIEGAATFATVWFNGTLIDRNWSGYSSIYADLTPFATFGDAVNTLAIRIDAHAMEGWWYEGGGLYRPVRLVKRNPVHIVTDGVFAHPVKTDSGWAIPVEVTARNIGRNDRTIDAIFTLRDPSGKVAATAHIAFDATALDETTGRLVLPVAAPRLWSIETPDLYTLETRLMDGTVCLDAVTTTCGFRTTHFDAAKGFFLNDRPVKIQGVCLHQDHAGVGTAIPDSIWEFRIRRLKELGCNAIRSSHNAPSRIVLDLCDRYGLMVMDENRQFNPSPTYMEQLRWMVRRDRNRPSIILWSVFNEEPMQGSEAGYEMVRRMAHEVRKLDTSRPVTAAMNGGFFTPVNVSAAVDVVGFNYNQDSYDAFHAAHPDVPMTSSEDTSAYSVRGAYVHDPDKHLTSGYDDPPAGWASHRAAWKMIATRDFVAGGFVWTGFDYHGEPSPWGWPSNSSMYGIMDLCGFDKDAFHIHQAQWLHDRPVVAILPHWNWAGHEGRPVKVMVCSNLDTVELFLNGRSQGRQKADRYEMNAWQVPYAPGRLEAVGYTGAKAMARARVETAGAAVALKVTPDRSRVAGDGKDAVPFRIEAVDAQGRTVPQAGHAVRFAVEGGDIIGLGNGDPNCLEPEKGDRRSLFNGLAQVIVQTRAGGAGTLVLRAEADGLKQAMGRVEIAAATAPPRQPAMASVQILDYWYCAPEADTPQAALANMQVDMTKWDDFGPRWLHDPQPKDGFTLVSAHFTPHLRIQKEGGVVHFPSITCAVDVYDGDTLAGRKTDPGESALTVPLKPGMGERRINLLFATPAGKPFAFKQNVLVEQKAAST